MKKLLMVMLIVLLSVSVANATMLIGAGVQNGDFQLPATGKVKILTGLIPNWTAWTEQGTTWGDTGVDTGVSSRIMFVQGSSSAKNMTIETIDVGEVFTYSIDSVRQGRGPISIALLYENAGAYTLITGTEKTLASPISPVVSTTISGSFTALAGQDYIGKTIGFGLFAPSGSNYPEVDNATLVPEPATMVLLGLGAAFVSDAGKRKTRWRTLKLSTVKTRWT